MRKFDTRVCDIPSSGPVMILHASSYSGPPLLLPSPSPSLHPVRWVKVCRTAQPYCPPASGTSPGWTRRSRCWSWVSAGTPLCRTAPGASSPSCSRRRTPWPVRRRHRFKTTMKQYLKYFLTTDCDLTLAASLMDTSPMEVRDGYSRPSCRSFSVTWWARACQTAQKAQFSA